MIKALASLGVSVDAPDPAGRPPMTIAGTGGNGELVKTLVNLGAKS